MEPSFAKLLALLADENVRFIVVGGVAVTLHGYVRLTEAVDILAQSDRSNLERLIAALSHFGEGFAMQLAPEDFDDSEGAMRIVEATEGCVVDVFTRMSGSRYDDVVSDAGTFRLNGHKIRFASTPTLIAWKEVSFREKNRLDAHALRKLLSAPTAFD
jgi:hypothetical protein